MDKSEGLLSRCFAEFYEELARIKVAAAQGRLPSYLGGASAPADIAAATATRLLALLAEQQKRVHTRANQTERQSYALARYFMAALADEVLALSLDWEGRDHWQHYLLERRLFGRSIAGSQFYAQTDKVLDTRGNDPLMADLASVALMALQLGFQGQYWGDAGLPQRTRYRKRLQQFIGAGGQTSLARPVFSVAYRGLISEARERRLAPFSRWYPVAAGIAVVYLVLSSVVWIRHMQDLRAVVPIGSLLQSVERTQPAAAPAAHAQYDPTAYGQAGQAGDKPATTAPNQSTQTSSQTIAQATTEPDTKIGKASPAESSTLRRSPVSLSYDASVSPAKP